MIVSFSGTSHGMNLSQRQSVLGLLQELQPDTVEHGDCVGADAEFHALACFNYGKITKVIIRPGCDGVGNMPKRFYCAKVIQPIADTITIVEHTPEPYLWRNDKIANDGDILIATPLEFKEQMRGSGTWATCRYAYRYRKEVKVVLPDGHVVPFRPVRR